MQEEQKADPTGSAVSVASDSGAADGGQPAGEAGDKPKGQAKDAAGQQTIKLVLTGDTAVGKSSLINAYLSNSFTEDQEPTVLDVYKGCKQVQKKNIEIEIHDTSGDEHLGVNRKAQYKDADVFMICVGADNLTYETMDIIKRWIHEI